MITEQKFYERVKGSEVNKTTDYRKFKFSIKNRPMLVNDLQRGAKPLFY